MLVAVPPLGVKEGLGVVEGDWLLVADSLGVHVGVPDGLGVVEDVWLLVTDSLGVLVGVFDGLGVVEGDWLGVCDWLDDGDCESSAPHNAADKERYISTIPLACIS